MAVYNHMTVYCHKDTYQYTAIWSYTTIFESDMRKQYLFQMEKHEVSLYNERKFYLSMGVVS